MRRWGKRPNWVTPVIVWITGAIAYWLAILWVKIFRPGSIVDGFKLRDETADSAWQTIRLWEMWVVGPEALWWEHIYPPLYDGIRFVLMQPEVLRGESPNVLAVDLRLYIVHSILFGLTAMIVYLWVRDLTGSWWWAAGGSVLWVSVPASLAFFVLLYQTGLAIAATTVALYLLYRFLRTRIFAYNAGFLVALWIASLTRNVVQIHVLLVVVVAGVAFWRITKDRRSWMLAVNLLLVALIGLWPARAFVLYGTFDVSTHTGYHRAGALWINPLEVPAYLPRDAKEKFEAYESARRVLDDPTALVTLSPDEIQQTRAGFPQLEQEWLEIQAQYPEVDFSTVKTYPNQLEENGTKLTSNWNNQEVLRENHRLGEFSNHFILTQPLEATSRVFRSLKITIPAMFRSVYVQWYNSFNSTFGPMRALDWVFSGWTFALIIVGSVTIVIAHFGIRGTMQRLRRYGWFAIFWTLTAIPVLLSNRYWPPKIPEPTHSEADRLRGLIDVPFYVLMVLAAFFIVHWLRARVGEGAAAGKDLGDAESTNSFSRR